MQKILNKRIPKIIIILSLSLGVFICGFVQVFADDLNTLPESDSNLAPEALPELSEEDKAFLLDKSEEILQILQTNELTASTAATYTVTDVYNLLYSALRGSSTATTWSIPYIAKLMQSIYNEVHGTVDFTAHSLDNTIYGLLKQLVLGPSNWDGNVAGPLADLAYNFHFDNITTVAEGEYSMKDLMYLLSLSAAEINEYLPNLIPTDYTSFFNTLINSVSSLNSKLNFINNDTTDIKNSLHRYKWNSLSMLYYYQYDMSDSETIFAEPTSFPYSFSNDLYIVFDSSLFNNSAYYNSVFRFDFPIEQGGLLTHFYIPTIEFYTLYNNRLYKINNVKSLVTPARFGFNLYFTYSNIVSNGSQLVIKLNRSSSTSSFTQYKSGILGFYVSNQFETEKDYNELVSYMNQTNNSDTLERIKDLYASDDLIKAKAAQQDYEDQALEDFTGSGSAATSTSDLGSLKNTSGAFKNGLYTSRSASDALSVFSSTSELWSWFSQNTLNDLDHTSQYQNRNLLKSNSNEDQILDFYNMNNQGLIDWMHP